MINMLKSVESSDSSKYIVFDSLISIKVDLEVVISLVAEEIVVNSEVANLVFIIIPSPMIDLIQEAK